MDTGSDGRSGIGLKVQEFLLRNGSGLLVSAATGIGVLGLMALPPPIRSPREITLTTQSVPLSVTEPAKDTVGSLRFLGGAALRSKDEGFGGLSGLIIEPDNRGPGPRIIAITDQGDKFTARLVMRDGRLAGLEGATLEPLVDPQGKPVLGKSFSDAESITRLPDGRILVGFERRHRIWAYGPGLTGPAKLFDLPRALAKAPSNGGLESIANWPDGRILAITEGLKTDRDNFAAFLFEQGAWTTVEWKASAPGFEPSDATVLPDGDLLVLERYWSALGPTRISSRITRVKGGNVKPGVVIEGELLAEFEPPLVTENFEGIAAFKNLRGATCLLLVSDNNFSGLQQTLLLSFELRGF